MHILTRVVSPGLGNVVEFRVGDGQMVTVTMSDREQQTDEQLVETARAILLKVAHSDMPDIGSVTGAAAKHCYALEYRDGDEVLTIPPVDLPDLDAVRAELRQSAIDLLKDALSHAGFPTGWAVRARDETGAIVASIDFEEVRHETAA